jgi:hypothetical protein
LLSRIIFLTRAEFGPGADRQRLARSPSVVILCCWSGCLDRRSGLRRAVVVAQQTAQALAALHFSCLLADFRRAQRSYDGVAHGVLLRAWLVTRVSRWADERHLATFAWPNRLTELVHFQTAIPSKLWQTAGCAESRHLRV